MYRPKPYISFPCMSIAPLIMHLTCCTYTRHADIASTSIFSAQKKHDGVIPAYKARSESCAVAHARFNRNVFLWQGSLKPREPEAAAHVMQICTLSMLCSLSGPTAKEGEGGGDLFYANMIEHNCNVPYL